MFFMPQQLGGGGKLQYNYRQPKNVIYYTSTDGSAISLGNVFGDAQIINNEYVDGLGTIKFDRDVKVCKTYAFRNSRFLSVELPNSVTSIGNDAFNGSSGLTSVDIGNSVASIGVYAFSGCRSLTSIKIPNSVTSIGDYAFQNLTSLTSIEIPNSVTTIGQFAFQNCSSLTSMIIPNIVESIGRSIFEGCSNIKTIYYNAPTFVPLYQQGGVNKKVQNLYLSDDVTKIETNACYDWRELKEVNLGNSITSIGQEVFRQCSGLTHVELPNTVRSIGTSTFSGCQNLTSVTYSLSLTTIPSYTFQGCSSLKELKNIDNVEIIKSQAFYGCGLDEFTTPSAATTVENDAFNGSLIKKVVITENVTSINGYAFSMHNALEELHWLSPTTITNLSGHGNLKKLVIGNKVPSIGSYALAGCGLTSVEIPNSVTKIESGAFASCSSLTSVTYNGTIEQWNAITKGTNWKTNVPTTCMVHCTDGDIAI